MYRIICFLIWILGLPGYYSYAQNAPVVIAGNTISSSDTVHLLVTATGIDRVASCSLTIDFDGIIASVASVTTGEFFQGGMNYNASDPSRIVIGWYTWPGLILPDNSVLFDIKFNRSAWGTTPVTFFDDGNSCYFSNDSSVMLNDIPSAQYYRNGSITFKRADGLDEKDVKGITFYPNPCFGEGTLSWEPESQIEKVEVYNTTGQKILLLENGFRGLNKMKIQDLVSGLNIIRITCKQGNERMLKNFRILSR